MSRGLLLLRFVMYAIGITAASVLASIGGGSAPLLVLYSLAVGAPFFLAASLIGLAFNNHVLEHPLGWSIAAPIVTGALWFGSGLTAGELLNGRAVGMYAMFCAACCGAAFYVGIRRWPLR
jgi:hypothetical protein